jgi:hypothetical protein
LHYSVAVAITDSVIAGAGEKIILLSFSSRQFCSARMRQKRAESLLIA